MPYHNHFLNSENRSLRKMVRFEIDHFENGLHRKMDHFKMDDFDIGSRRGGKFSKCLILEVMEIEVTHCRSEPLFQVIDFKVKRSKMTFRSDRHHEFIRYSDMLNLTSNILF